MAVFLNTNVIITFFQNLPLFRVKNAIFFARFLGENILKLITLVLGANAMNWEIFSQENRRESGFDLNCNLCRKKVILTLGLKKLANF
jgi:hypothetical protein